MPCNTCFVVLQQVSVKTTSLVCQSDIPEHTKQGNQWSNCS